MIPRPAIPRPASAGFFIGDAKKTCILPRGCYNGYTLTKRSETKMFYNVQEQEERDFHVSSIADCDRAYAHEVGANHPEWAWVLSDRDVWYRNPSYKGAPQPHPDDAEYESENDAAHEPEQAEASNAAQAQHDDRDDDIPF